jgi:hypothetical protein
MVFFSLWVIFHGLKCVYIDQNYILNNDLSLRSKYIKFGVFLEDYI